MIGAYVIRSLVGANNIRPYNRWKMVLNLALGPIVCSQKKRIFAVFFRIEYNQ